MSKPAGTAPERTDDILSIVVPCYNQSAFLEACLDSILAQTDERWEVIVVNDASQDADEIQRIVCCRKDSRITLLAHAMNRGLAAARNTGARAANGAYLVFLDSDDKLNPHFVHEILRAFEECRDVQVVYTLFEAFGETTGVDRWRGSKTILQHQLRYWIRGAGTAMRHTVFELVGGFCEDPLLRIGMEDREFWIASISKGLQVAQIPKALYCWRRYAGSMSRNMENQRHKLHRFIASRHRATMEDLNVYHAFLAEGYLRSARSSTSRATAIALSILGLVHTVKDKRLWSVLKSALLRADWKNRTLPHRE